MRCRNLAFAAALVAASILAAAQGRAQSSDASDAQAAGSRTRRVYEGVVSVKQKPLGTVILMEVNGSNLSGWIRLDKFAAIEGGSVADNEVEFRAAGNSYKIDERKGRIVYSGPDGSGDRIVAPLTAWTGTLNELTESERFSGNDIATLEMGARLRRLEVIEPALWKTAGPPFEKYERLDVLLGHEVTMWVVDPDTRPAAIVIEEPAGMNIPLKAPKPPKEPKQKNKK